MYVCVIKMDTLVSLTINASLTVPDN